MLTPEHDVWSEIRVIKAFTNVRKSKQEGSPAHIVTEYEQLL